MPHVKANIFKLILDCYFPVISFFSPLFVIKKPFCFYVQAECIACGLVGQNELLFGELDKRA